MDARSGSQVRPWRLLQAFKSLGHEVEPITGYGTERQQAMRRVLEDQSRGRRYDFVCSPQNRIGSRRITSTSR